MASYHAIPYHTVQYHTLPYHTPPHCTGLHNITSHCIPSHHTAPHGTTLHCTALHCIALHCFVLYCNLIDLPSGFIWYYIGRSLCVRFEQNNPLQENNWFLISLVAKVLFYCVIFSQRTLVENIDNNLGFGWVIASSAPHIL